MKKNMVKTIGSLSAKFAAMLLAFMCVGRAWGDSQVAQVITDGGATTNKFESFEAAFAAANAAGTATIQMLESLGSTGYTVVQDNPRLYAIDAALTNVSVMVAKTSNITLDLNGKTISAVDNTGAGFSFIDNKGTFTVVDSTADASGNAAGVLCYGSLTPNKVESPTYGNYVINNTGTVTIESGTVMNNCRYTRIGLNPAVNPPVDLLSGASFAINSSASGADSWVYVNGGVVYNYATAAIRAFGSDSYTAHIVVSGGQVTGYPAIWLQNPNSSPTSAAKIDLQIDDGQISHTSATGVYDAIMSSTFGALLDNVTITINGGTIEGYVDVGDDRMESSETVTITGGTFLTENAIACYAASDAEIGKIQISGGQFATQVPEKYCATGYLPTDADPVTGKYTVMEGAYVAQIGTTKYTSLEDAFAAANAAGTATIQMLEDVDVTNVAYVVSSGKTITLDLNGKTVKGTDDTNTGFAFITNNGTFTLDDTSENHDGELVYGTQTPDMNPVPGHGNYTIENTGTLNIVAGTVRQETRGPACYAVNNSSRTSNAVFNMQGGLMTSPGTVMRAYGLSNTYENEINLSGGSIAATGAAALIVQLGSSAPKVTLNVTGGSMSGRDYAFLDMDWGNSLENVTYNVQAGTFTGEVFTFGATTEISGGTFNGPVTEKAGDLTISGGTFNGTVEAYGGGSVQISNGTFNGTVVADDNGTALISGGQFVSRVPDDYCAAGYVPTDLDPDTGMYTVAPGAYVAQIVTDEGATTNKYTSLAEAVAAVPTDGTETTIEMIADYSFSDNAGVTIAKTQNVVLDLNGHVVSHTADIADTSQCINNNGTLTIKDSSDTNADGTGKLTTFAAVVSTDDKPPYANNLILNKGEVTVMSGLLENTSAVGATYVIDLGWPEAGRHVKVNIDGGCLSSPHSTGVRINSFVVGNNDYTFNMTGGKIEVYGHGIQTQSEDNGVKVAINISGGTVISDSYWALYDKNANTAATAYNNMSYNITGGTFSAPSSGIALYTRGAAVDISGGVFENQVLAYTKKVNITGGEFDDNVSFYCLVSGATLDWSVSGGKFGGEVDDYELHPTGFITGGVFTLIPYEDMIAEGYFTVDNTDAETMAAYPYTVAAAILRFVYPIEGTAGVPVARGWLAAQFPSIYPDATKLILPSITNDLVQALSANGANDMPKWESYVLGLDPADPTAKLRLTATSKDATTVTITGTIDTAKFPEPVGTTVKFRLAKRNGDEWTNLATDSEMPSFDCLLEDVVGEELAIFADIVTE